MNPKPVPRNAAPRRMALRLIALWVIVIGQVSCAKQPSAVNDAARFVGTWDLVSVSAQWPDGHVTNPWGNHPPGRLIYTQAGHMLVLCMHELRNEATREAVAPALQNEAAGYFGTYKVNAMRHIVSHLVNATLRHAEAGILDRTYEFKRGELYLTAKATHDGQPVTYVLVWKRA